jgi:hypothetical protein
MRAMCLLGRILGNRAVLRWLCARDASNARIEAAARSYLLLYQEWADLGMPGRFVLWYATWLLHWAMLPVCWAFRKRRNGR